MTITALTKTIDQTISTAPTAPSAGDSSTFDALADPFMAYIEGMDDEYNPYGTDVNDVTTDINARIVEMNLNATAMNTIKSDTQAIVDEAAAIALAADNASNASLYDPAITGGYSVGDVVYSSGGLSYRCIQTQAEGSVEAITNEAYWTALIADPDPLPDIFMMGF